MSFASEKLYKGYLRRNMPTIVSKVKVREIIIHLPCLTDHDRETIEAKRETNGNYDGMVLLLDCLKRRENWPEQLIEALEACEQPAIAADIRAEYNALRGINNTNPSSPSTTVVSAHVHPPPSANHPFIPESGGAPCVEPSAPPEQAAHTSPALENPVQQQATQSSAAQVPKAVTPPKPVPETTQSAQIEAAPPPSTPPPSPATAHIAASTPPLPPQREFNTHREPEENSESDIQDIAGVIPDQVSSGNGKVLVNSLVTLPPSHPVEQCETETLSCTQSGQTSTTVTDFRPPQSPSVLETNGSSFPILTPENPPVQDTTFPVGKVLAAVPEPEETSEPPATQVADNRQQTSSAATASTVPDTAVAGASLFDDNSACLSKPGRLISFQPLNHGNPTMPATNALVEPYSGNSGRLEISDASSETVTSAHIPACSAVNSTTVNTATGLLCQDDGTALNHNDPEENHYDSPCQSLEMQEVRMNVVHVSQEPSILNLEGQTSAPQAQIVNSEDTKEISSTPRSSNTPADAISISSTRYRENYHPSEPAPQPHSEENTASCSLTTNTKYILAAAGVAAFALLMAWKFRN